MTMALLGGIAVALALMSGIRLRGQTVEMTPGVVEC
jgi:hypothetical protein